MRALRRQLKRLISWTTTRRDEDRLQAEIAEHLTLLTAEYVRAGMSPDEARRQAYLNFGGVEPLKEIYREQRGLPIMDTLIRDIRHASRRLWMAPTFAFTTVLTLAIGIGANSAIFSVVNGVILKPLPFPHPDELITVNHAAPGVNLPRAGTAPFLHFTYHDHASTFHEIGIYRWAQSAVTGQREPETALALNVTAQVLPVLGVQPILGRWFSDRDDSPGARQTAVLTYGWWQARFGGDVSVIGRTITVDGVPREVIGVMPASFRFLDRDAAFLLPLQLDRSKTVLGQVSFQGIGRLKPGVTIEQAAADLARLIPIALHSYPPQPGFTTKAFEDVRFAPRMEPLKQSLIGDLSKTLWVLMGTIAIVLLIACANVANLLLVRAEARQHELAVRAALGARWRDLAGELMVESVALGLIGGLAGLALAYAAIRALIAMAPANLPRLLEISIDPAVVVFTFTGALLSGAVLGLIPIIKYARPSMITAVRGGGRTSSQSRERYRTRGVLVVVQVALAVILLVGSGLMIRTFQALRHVDPGFDPKDALTMRLSIPVAEVRDPVAVARLEQGILRKIGEIPGVTAAGIASFIPTDAAGVGRAQLYARDKVYDRVPPLRRWKFISPGLLDAMGNRLVAGREFTWTDVFDGHPVAMVSENLARELWGDPRLAIGKQIVPNLKDPWREVIGVVGDERADGMQADAPEVAYYPILVDHFDGNPVVAQRSAAYVIRSKRAVSQDLLTEVQRAVWSLNAGLPLADVRQLEEVYSKSMERTSFTLVMLALAGGMALLIGVVGIYGVMAYAVLQRRREIGIRMALGAAPRNVAGIFIVDGFRLALAGIVCGLAGAAAVTRVLVASLFGVSPLDPLTFVAVPVGLILMALIASYIPAHRAIQVDPLQQLRLE
jgi:putative ABC transport system permease protein